MSPELSRRVGAIVGAHPVTPDEREQIIAAVQSVEDWDELPADIRELLESIQQRPGRGASHTANT